MTKSSIIRDMKETEQILKWFLTYEPWDKETIQELRWAIEDYSLLLTNFA